MVHYRNRPVTYAITAQESDVYQLHLNGGQGEANEDYVPQKVVIRKKGKIWVSDAENYMELIDALKTEIEQIYVSKES